MLRRGETRHPRVGLAGRFRREGGSIVSCLFPMLEIKCLSLSRVCGLVLCCDFFFLQILHPKGWEGRGEGRVGGGRKAAAQNPSSKILNKDLKGDKEARQNPTSCTMRVPRQGGQLHLSCPIKPEEPVPQILECSALFNNFCLPAMPLDAENYVFPKHAVTSSHTTRTHSEGRREGRRACPEDAMHSNA